jgi:hypothetical protein
LDTFGLKQLLVLSADSRDMCVNEKILSQKRLSLTFLACCQDFCELSDSRGAHVADLQSDLPGFGLFGTNQSVNRIILLLSPY